jgi:hypothetical protein
METEKPTPRGSAKLISKPENAAGSLTPTRQHPRKKDKFAESSSISHLKYPSEDLEDDADMHWSRRLSKRYRSVDPTKDLIILRSSDDPVDVVGIHENERDEFNRCMNEPCDEGSDAEGELLLILKPATPKRGITERTDSVTESISVVLTPGVALRNDLSRKISKRPNNFRERAEARFSQRAQTELLSRQIVTRSAEDGPIKEYYYGDYDVDEEDDAEIQRLNTYIAKEFDDNGCTLSTYAFEVVISLLERQLERAQYLSAFTSSCQSASASCHARLEAADKLSVRIHTFLKTASKDSGDDECSNLACDIEALSGLREVSTNEVVPVSEDSYTHNVEEAVPQILPVRRGRKRKNDCDTVVSARSTSSLSEDGHSSNVKSLRSSTGFQGTDSCLHCEYETDTVITTLDETQIRTFVPFPRVTLMLQRFLVGQAKQKTNLIDGSTSSAIFQGPGFVYQLSKGIYEYWVTKRAGRQVSLVRCFHDFIMHNWQRSDVSIVEPSYPTEDTTENICSAMTGLQCARKDLDKVRVIIDRLRRREKLKRDLVRLSIESLGLDFSRTDQTLTRGVINVTGDQFEPFSIQQDTETTGLDMSGLTGTNVVSSSEQDVHLRKIPNSRDVSVPLAANIEDSLVDKCLVLGVACCGLRRLDTIREEFGVMNHYSDDQLSKRFNQMAQGVYHGGTIPSSPEHNVLSRIGVDRRRAAELVNCFSGEEV